MSTIRPRFNPPETRLLLFPSGMILDSSGFTIAFDGETPTTIGKPAIYLRKVETVIADALERAWERVTNKVQDVNGDRLVIVNRGGAPCLVPLEELRYVELAAILSEAAA